jgi:hypothetical protein
MHPRLPVLRSRKLQSCVATAQRVGQRRYRQLVGKAAHDFAVLEAADLPNSERDGPLAASAGTVDFAFASGHRRTACSFVASTCILRGFLDGCRLVDGLNGAEPL